MNDIEKLEEIERAFAPIYLEYSLRQQLRELFSIARASLKREERHAQLATPAEHLVEYNKMLDERLKALRQQLAERDATICEMREALRPFVEHSGDVPWWEQFGTAVYEQAAKALAQKEGE